jgi:hypothetical protein
VDRDGVVLFDKQGDRDNEPRRGDVLA